MSFLQLLLLSRENGYPLAILYSATAMGNSKCSQPGLLPSPCLVRFCVRLLRLVDCEQSPAPFVMLLEFPMIVPPIDCLLLCLRAEVFLFFELGYVAPQVFQMTLDRKQQPGSLTSICAWCLQIPSQRHSALSQLLRPGPTHGIFDQRGSRFELQLFAYVEAMRFDGLGSQVQELADLARRQTLADQTKDFRFTIGELAEGGIVRALSAAGKDFRGLSDIFSLR